MANARRAWNGAKTGMTKPSDGSGMIGQHVSFDCVDLGKESQIQAWITRRHSWIVLFVIMIALALALTYEEQIFVQLGFHASPQEDKIYRILVGCIFAATSFTTVLMEMGLLLKVKDQLHVIIRVLKSCAACLAFMVVGPALMVLNKHLMEEGQFAYPLTLSSVGLVSSSIVAHIAALLGAPIRAESREVVAGRRWFFVVFPICLAKAVTLAAGNTVYLHLGLGFIQMLKAFCPCVVLIVMFIAGVELPTRASTWCAIVIVLGTLVEVRGEMHASFFGLLLMCVTEVAEAISLVLSGKLLQNHKFTVLEGMYFLAGPSAIVLIVLAAATEWQHMVAHGRHHIIVERPLETLVAAPVLGVAVNFLSFWVVQLTSPATLKILNTVRCIGLVLFSIVVYEETCTLLQLCGYSVSLVGFVGYNFFQMRRDLASSVEAWVLARFGCCRDCPQIHRAKESEELHDLIEIGLSESDRN